MDRIDDPQVKRAPVRYRLAQVAVGVTLAAGVVFPLTARGWLLLLDWAPGPREALPALSRALERGTPASAVLDLLTAGLRAGFGPAAAGWLAFAIALVVGFYAAAELVGGPLPRRIAAGLAYTVNPVVYERAYAGQFGFLLAAAVLPLAAREILRCRTEPGRWVQASLWTAIAIGFTPHAAWIIGTFVVGVALTSRTARAAGRLAAFSAATVLLNLYLFIPALTAPAQVSIGEGDLRAFETRADAQLGLVGNVAALYGFWRPGPALPKDNLFGWPFLFLAFLVICAAGCVYSRRRPEMRAVIIPLGIAGALCLILASGTRGPIGPLFEVLFTRVPGFEIMREPQKFVIGLALFYAAAFALGAEAMVAGVAAGWRRTAVAAVALIVPIACTPTLFAGLAGQVTVSQVPASWDAADDAMGDGDGKVLFLPWHQYMAFPFTGRVVANPAAAFFRRAVISSDDAELPGLGGTVSGQSDYLEHFYARGPGLCAFGDLLAPLGVEFVVVAKAVDWRRYEWLGRQVDLTRVSESADLIVYRNQRYRGIAWVAPERGVRDWEQVEALSREGGVSLHAVSVEQPGRVEVAARRGGACSPPPAETRVPAGRRTSPTSYRLPAGVSGHAVLAEEFDSTWSGGAGGVTPLVADRVGIPADGQQREVRLGRARWTLAGWFASGAAALLLLALVAVARVRQSTRA